jgi:exodeoxyribonuclease-1
MSSTSNPTREIDNFKIFTYDYETTGLGNNPLITESAYGVTDGFNLKGGKFVDQYIKPVMDRVPSPQAFAVTGIKMETLNNEGVTIAQAMREFQKDCLTNNEGKPVIISGYNIKSYDLPITRYWNYMNGIDPYLAEWSKNNKFNMGNRILDVFDIVQTVYALRPDLLTIPMKEDGSPSLKLEDLCTGNGIGHEHAHNALSDIYATIGLAKLIDEQNPNLVDHVFSKTSKDNMRPFFQKAIGGRKLLVNVNRLHSMKNSLGTVCMAIGNDKVMRDKVMFLDLRHDIRSLLDLTAEEINHHRFLRKTDESKIITPFFMEQNNRSLTFDFAPFQNEVEARMNIDMDMVKQNEELINSDPAILHEIRAKLHNLAPDFGKSDDLSDQYSIYSGLNVENLTPNGDFVSSEGFLDRTSTTVISNATKLDKSKEEYSEFLEDTNILEVVGKAKDFLRTFQMLSRKKWLILKEIPNSIEDISEPHEAYEIKKVIEHVERGLMNGHGKNALTLDAFQAEYDGLMEEKGDSLDENKLESLSQLSGYVDLLRSNLENLKTLYPLLDGVIENASEEELEVMGKIDYLESANFNKLYIKEPDNDEEASLDPDF